MSWVTDKREQQERERAERERRGGLLEGHSSIRFTTLEGEVRELVDEINEAYSSTFNRNTNSHLVFVGGMSNRFEVRCGPNTALSVEYSHTPPNLKVTRRLLKWAAGGERTQTAHYFFALDSQDDLRLTIKEGKTVRVVSDEAIAQELLDFLTD